MNTKHGVITATRLITLEDGQVRELPALSSWLTDLCQIAQDNRLSHLWVMPDSGIIPDMASFHEAFLHWNLKPTWELGEDEIEGMTNHLRSVYGWARTGENRNGFYVIFLGPWAAWEWARKQDITPKQVLWMVGHLERELGIPITSSPGNTGRKYLESLHPRHQEWFNPPNMDLTTLPFDQARKSLNWTRVPTDEELSRKYLLKIDKNSAFPRAGVEYKFGVGDVCHFQEGDDIRDPTKIVARHLVGIWRIAHDANNNFGLTPPIVNTEWITTPILNRLYQKGCYVRILEGWYFPDSFHVFKAWAENLWKMRAKFTDARRDAFKQVLNDTFGLYRSAKLEGDDGVFRRRPDWYAQTVGGTRAIMLQNIDSFATKFLLYPVITSIDCILYCSDKPLVEVLPDNREQLGFFKHVWQLDITDEIQGILASNMNANKKLALLNAIAREGDA